MLSCSRDDSGAGTVLALAMVAVVLLLMAWLGLLAGAQEGRGRAQTAADLGAIAGAQGALMGEDGCRVAEETVRRNGAVPTGCDVLGWGIVRVSSSVRAVVGTATAEARAGPRGATSQDR